MGKNYQCPVWPVWTKRRGDYHGTPTLGMEFLAAFDKLTAEKNDCETP
ncbi:MAG: hypothetical protein HWQ35_23765 [Nostoc sp. NMS1]|nr:MULTISPECIES: hypothetical protein [unclassified Nostoc]MBN3909450.1 hypothetical protein [Nostoc sp. NMS1]MBN3994312.1 hypothetical protein [Nostoc sp. NMS2]